MGQTAHRSLKNLRDESCKSNPRATEVWSLKQEDSCGSRDLLLVLRSLRHQGVISQDSYWLRGGADGVRTEEGRCGSVPRWAADAFYWLSACRGVSSINCGRVGLEAAGIQGASYSAPES